MPIYEYQCAKCGHHHEALQKMSDPPLRKCPDCGRQALTRLVSAVRFRLSGSGWYETDFKSDQETRRNLAASGDDAPADKDKDKDKDKKAEEPAAAPAKAETTAAQGEAKSRKTVAVSRPTAKTAPTRKAPAKTAVRPAARRKAATPAAKKKSRR